MAGTRVDAAALSIGGAALGTEIIRVLDPFQNKGLLQPADPTRERFIKKYQRFEPDHCH